LIRLYVDAEESAKLRSIRHYNGLPISTSSVMEQILSEEGIRDRRRTGHSTREYNSAVIDA
jgi:hypothetical protein